MTVIDFRFRVPTAPFAAAGAASHHCLWWRPTTTRLWREETEPVSATPGKEPTLDDCIEWMEAADVVGVLPGRHLPCASVPNQHLDDLVTAHPRRLIAVAGVDPSDPGHLAEVERWLDRGFAGVQLEVGWLRPAWLPDDARLDPLYELCAARDRIVVVHVGPIGGPDLDHTRPDALCRAARRHPGLRFVMAHAAYPFVDDAVMAVFKHDNVWLGPDPYLEFPGAERFVQWANRSDLVADRILYGSSLGWPQAPDALARFQRLGWRDDVLERVLHRNAATLLGR